MLCPYLAPSLKCSHSLLQALIKLKHTALSEVADIHLTDGQGS